MTAYNYNFSFEIIQNLKLEFLSNMEYFSGGYWCENSFGCTLIWVVQNRSIPKRETANLIQYFLFIQSAIKVETNYDEFYVSSCLAQVSNRSPFWCHRWSISKFIENDWIAARDVVYMFASLFITNYFFIWKLYLSEMIINIQVW